MFLYTTPYAQDPLHKINENTAHESHMQYEHAVGRRKLEMVDSKEARKHKEKKNGMCKDSKILRIHKLKLYMGTYIALA